MTSVSVNDAVIGHDGERCASSFFVTVRVWISPGRGRKYGCGIPIRLMVDERHLRCLIKKFKGDVVVSSSC